MFLKTLNEAVEKELWLLVRPGYVLPVKRGFAFCKSKSFSTAFTLPNLVAGDLALSTHLCTNSAYSCDKHAFYGQGDGQAILWRSGISQFINTSSCNLNPLESVFMFVCFFVCLFFNWWFLVIDQLDQDCGYKIPGLKITPIVQLSSPGSQWVCKLHHSSSTKRD